LITNHVRNLKLVPGESDSEASDVLLNCLIFLTLFASLSDLSLQVHKPRFLKQEWNLRLQNLGGGEDLSHGERESLDVDLPVVPELANCIIDHVPHAGEPLHPDEHRIGLLVLLQDELRVLPGPCPLVSTAAPLDSLRLL